MKKGLWGGGDTGLGTARRVNREEEGVMQRTRRGKGAPGSVRSHVRFVFTWVRSSSFLVLRARAGVAELGNRKHLCSW